MRQSDKKRLLLGGQASSILKTIGNPINLQILMLLTGGGMNTREIARILNREESDVSRRLRKLRELGLVRSQWSRVGGRNVKIYRLASEKLSIQIDKSGLRIVDGMVSSIDLQEWTGLAWRPPRPPQHFVGRQKELKLLRRAYRESPVLLITGLPGIGKTSLVAYWLEKDNIKPVLWHWSTPSDYSDIILKRIALFLSSQGKARLRNHLSRSPGDTETSIPIAVEELSELGATLVIDDVHKITDPRTLDLISILARRAGDYKLILLSRQVPKLPLDVHRIESIVLEGISKKDTEKLVGMILDSLPSPETIEKLHLTFEGHPMLIKWAIDLARREGIGILDHILAGHLPARRFIEELYRSLDPTEQKVLAVLSCIGGRLPKQEDWGVLRKNKEQRALNRLVDKNVVIETPFYYVVKELVHSLMLKELSKEQCRPPAEALIRKFMVSDDPQRYLEAFSVAAHWGYDDLILELIRNRIVVVKFRIFDYLPSYKILLEKAMKNASDPHVRAALLTEKGVVAYNLEKNTDKAIEYLHAAIPYLKEIDENLILAFVYSRLIVYDEENALEMARHAFRHASLIKNERARHVALDHIHSNLAYYYSKIKDVDKMLYHVEEEVKHSKLAGDVEGYWFSVFQREIMRFLAHGKADMKMISQARIILNKKGVIDNTLTIATYESLLNIILGNINRAIRLTSSTLQEMAERTPSSIVVSHVCNLAALLDIALEKKPSQRNRHSKITKRLHSILDECYKNKAPSCFYWKWHEIKGSIHQKREAENMASKYCKDYDLYLFKRIWNQ